MSQAREPTGANIMARLTKKQKTEAVAHILTLSEISGYTAGDVVHVAYPETDEDVPAVALDDHYEDGAWIPQALICRVLNSSGAYDHVASEAKARIIGRAIKGIEIAGPDASPVLYAGPGTALVPGAHLCLLMSDREIPGLEIVGSDEKPLSPSEAREFERKGRGKPDDTLEIAEDLAPVQPAKPAKKPAGKKTAKKKAGKKAATKKPGAAPLKRGK